MGIHGPSVAQRLHRAGLTAIVLACALILGGCETSPVAAQAIAVREAIPSGPSASQRERAIVATNPPGALMLGVANHTLVSQVTGPEATTPTADVWNVHGTDLGHMFWHREALYMVFGDTFGAGSRHWGRHWRSNAVARVAPLDLRSDVLRIESMVTGPDGTAREVIPSRKVNGEEMTVIPTNGISTGDRMFLHYMSVRRWGEHGHWDVGRSGLAYSDDDGETWVVPPEAVWPTGLGFEQVAFVRQGGYVYSFGIPGGRHGSVKLRRVPEARMLEPAAHEYWNGSAWVPAAEAAATIVPAPAGELSVAWNARHGQWMMMYLDPSRHAIVLRLSPHLTGPWSEPQTVVTAHDQPGLYAPYIVPLPETGDEVWFTMSKWGPYNVYLMKMTLEAAVADAGGPGPD